MYISRFFHSHTVELTKFLYHNFSKNFRENNFVSKEFTMKLISRNNSQVMKPLEKHNVAVNGAIKE